MTTDKLLYFSEGQAITATADSTNTVQVGGKIVGKDLNLLIEVTQDADFATLTSLKAALKTSDDESNWTTVLELPAAAVANLKKGSRPWGFVKLPYEMKKFAKISYTVTGSNATAGKVNAFLTPSNEQSL